MKNLYLFAVLLFALSIHSNTSFAQRSFYSVIEGGAQLGFANEGYQGAFNGYAFHFVFGQNFAERGFLGLGFGNETFTGKYQTDDPHDANQTQYEYDTYLMPIFIDGRLPIGYFGQNSRVGLLANGGYAPKIGPVYDRGFLFRGGFFYLYETMGRTNYTASLSYGYQQLSRNNHNPNRNFEHQHISLSVGVILK